MNENKARDKEVSRCWIITRLDRQLDELIVFNKSLYRAKFQKIF